MANNFGLGFTFTGTDKFSGTVGRIESAHKRVQKAAEKTNAVAAAGGGKGLARFAPKAGLVAAGGVNGAKGLGSFVPKGFSRDVGGATKGIGGVKSALDGANKGAKEGGILFNALGTALGNLASSAVTAGLRGVKNGIVGSAVAAIDFESAMADVNKVLPEGTELKPIADGAKQLAKDIGILPNEVAALTASLAQSGIAGDELTLVAGDASRLAVAFGMSGEDSGQALAKLRTGLGLTRPEVNSLTGTINELSNKLAATAPEITDAVQRVGSVAKAANISAESAAGLATAMIASGATAEVAATGTKTFLRALGAGDAATKRQRAAFKALGLSHIDVAKQLTSGGAAAEATIRDVVSRIGDLDQADKLPNLIRLFGSESIGAIGPLATNIKLLNQAFEISGNKVAAAGSVQKEYETRSKTTGAAIDRLKANFAVLAIEIGDKLLPYVNKGIAGLTWLIEKSRVWGAQLLEVGGRVATLASKFVIFEKIRLLYQGLVQAFSQGGFSGAVRAELDRAENSGLKKFVIRIFMLFGRLRVFLEGVAHGFMLAWEVVGPKFVTLFESLKAIAVSLFNVFSSEGNEVATSSMSSWREWGDLLGSAIGTVLDWTVSLIGAFASLIAENEWLVKGAVYTIIVLKGLSLGLVFVRGLLYLTAIATKAYGMAMRVAAIGMKIFRVAVAGVTLVMKALRLAALSNPIVALIAAIVLGAVLLYKYWGPIKEFFAGLWDSVVSAFKTAIDWILEQIKWVGEKVEEYMLMVMTPQAAELYIKLKTDKSELESADFGKDDRDAFMDQHMGGGPMGGGPRDDALLRARAEAVLAPRKSLTENIQMGVGNAAAQARDMAKSLAFQVGQAQEASKMNAATGGQSMSVNLIVDGEKLAGVVAKKGKSSKARTFSQVDPRDDEE